MSDDDYLWTKDGLADGATKDLEALLGQAKFKGMTFPAARTTPRRKRALLFPAFALAAAAAATLIIVLQTDGVHVVDDGSRHKLATGQWLETGVDQRLTLELARDIGVVEVRGDSRVRVQRVDGQQQRLELSRGSVHAVVSAPPRLFVVDTPSATAVDLGCEYELRVDGDGASHLRVQSGRVVLEGAGLGTTVLADMWAVTPKDEAPGVAFDLNASPGFIVAVERLATDPHAVEVVTQLAGPRDAVTLWQLRERATGEVREKLEARLETLVPRPPDGDWFEACASLRAPRT